MHQFLKENSVAVAGSIIALISIYMYSFYTTTGISLTYSYFSGFIFGCALGIATMRFASFTSEMYLILYSFSSQVIYFIVYFMALISIRKNMVPASPNALEFLIFTGIPAGIGAVLLLLQTQLMLKLRFRKILYPLIFAGEILLITAAYLLEEMLPNKMFASAVPLWQFAFSLTLNAIIKRQKAELLKTAAQKYL